MYRIVGTTPYLALEISYQLIKSQPYDQVIFPLWADFAHLITRL